MDRREDNSCPLIRENRDFGEQGSERRLTSSEAASLHERNLRDEKALSTRCSMLSAELCRCQFAQRTPRYSTPTAMLCSSSGTMRRPHPVLRPVIRFPSLPSHSPVNIFKSLLKRSPRGNIETMQAQGSPPGEAFERQIIPLYVHPPAAALPVTNRHGLERATLRRRASPAGQMWEGGRSRKTCRLRAAPPVNDQSLCNIVAKN
nr:hypothetical protein CFP56_36218 [Quercus suber]